MFEAKCKLKNIHFLNKYYTKEAVKQCIVFLLQRKSKDIFEAVASKCV